MTAKVNAVKCTHCGAHTANVPIWRAAYANVLGVPRAEMVSDSIQVVECAACAEEILVERSSNKAVWPLAADRAPESLPSVVGEAYHDALLALAAGSKIGALMAMRTMGERLLRDIGLSRFSQLAGKGVITPAQYGVLDQNRLWANVFGHEDIRTDRIDLSEIAEMFTFVRTILETIYTQPKAVERFVELTKEFQEDEPPF